MIILISACAEPHTTEFFNFWKNRAAQNFKIFDEVFCVLPNNKVFAMPDPNGWENVSEDYQSWLRQYQNRYVSNTIDYTVLLDALSNSNFSPAKVDPEGALEMVKKICGTLVIHPLDFLKDETKISTFADLCKNPSMGLSKEGLAQWLTGHLFEWFSSWTKTQRIFFFLIINFNTTSKN